VRASGGRPVGVTVRPAGGESRGVGVTRLRRVSSPFAPPPGPAAHVERALCVLAHPDDVDFGSAGTVATWTAAGTEVTYCIVTDGDAGGFDETPRDQMGPLRQAEQRAAAKAVGVEDVRFLGYPDGRLELTLDLRRDISRVIRQVRPQRVLTSSPERWYDRIGASHPDHMTVGESTLRAVYPDARNPFAFPELLADEGLEAWTVSEVWLGASPRADHAVDVTDVVERKFAALLSHVTQVSHQPEGQLQEFVTGWMRQTARTHGLPEGRLAEVFHVVHTA
jgi:LmbE family N-acetylglucosaminyl deacetylase